MRRCLILLGITGVVTMTLLLREIVIVFGGSEPAFVVGFGIWMLCAAAGLAAAKLFFRSSVGAPMFSLLLAAQGVSAPLILMCLRAMPTVVEIPHDSLPSLLVICASALLLPASIASGLFGLAWAIDVRRGDEPQAVGASLFAFVAGGAAIGGLLVTYALIDVTPLQSLCGLAAIHAIAAFFIWMNSARKPLWGWAIPTLAVAFGVVAFSPMGLVLDHLSQAAMHRDALVERSFESDMGRVHVRRSENQTRYYLNGSLAATQGDAEESERALLMAVLSHHAPYRLLIVGFVPDDVFLSAVELPWLYVDFLPLDASFARAGLRHAPAPVREAASNERVRILWELDPKLFMQRARRNYDVIYFQPPANANGAVARYLTMEFFADTRRALNDHGVFFMRVPGQEWRSCAAHWRSLGGAFGSVVPLNWNNSISFISRAARLEQLQPAEYWTTRMAQWKVHSPALTAQDLRNALSISSIRATALRLRNIKFSARSTTLKPLPYRAEFSGWSAYLQKRQIRLLAHLNDFDFMAALIAIVFATGAGMLWVSFARGEGRGTGLALIFAGAAAQAALTSGMLLLQSCCALGLEQWGFVLGASAGACAAGMLFARHFSSRSDQRVALVAAMALAVWCALGGAAWIMLSKVSPSQTQIVGMILWLLIASGAGAVCAFALSFVPQQTAMLQVWACAGSGIGAVIFGIVLMPLLGLSTAMFAACALALAAVPLLWFSGRLRSV